MKFNMREIKYKLWCFNKNEWEQNRYCLLHNGDIYDLDNGVVLSKENHMLVECTGGKDKNDKDIYEYDIVTFYHHREKEDEFNPLCFGVVKFVDGSFIIHDERMCPYLGTIFIDEIKGNVFQNPELIEDRL